LVLSLRSIITNIMALGLVQDRTLYTTTLAALEIVAARVVETMTRRIAYIQALHAPQRMILGVVSTISHRMEVMKPLGMRAWILLASAVDMVLT
jgi:hypothetical protein